MGYCRTFWLCTSVVEGGRKPPVLLHFLFRACRYFKIIKNGLWSNYELEVLIQLTNRYGCRMQRKSYLKGFIRMRAASSRFFVLLLEFAAAAKLASVPHPRIFKTWQIFKKSPSLEFFKIYNSKIS